MVALINTKRNWQQGFLHKPKVLIFYETYTPIVKFASMIAIFTLEAIYNLEIHQIDVKGDFIDEELAIDIQDWKIHYKNIL